MPPFAQLAPTPFVGEFHPTRLTGQLGLIARSILQIPSSKGREVPCACEKEISHATFEVLRGVFERRVRRNGLMVSPVRRYSRACFSLAKLSCLEWRWDRHIPTLPRCRFQATSMDVPVLKDASMVRCISVRNFCYLTSSLVP